MVSHFLNSNDWPNSTSWFWFNQWPNRSHLYTPGKPKAHISWLCLQNWNSIRRLGFFRSQSQIACEPQNWKLWKTNQPNEMALVWWKTTQIRQLNENKIFLQREFVQFRKVKFFPAIVEFAVAQVNKSKWNYIGIWNEKMKNLNKSYGPYYMAI